MNDVIALKTPGPPDGLEQEHCLQVKGSTEQAFPHWFVISDRAEDRGVSSPIIPWRFVSPSLAVCRNARDLLRCDQ